MGRSGDTMFCGLACVLHTGAGQCRSGRSAIPCGGCAGRSWELPGWVAGGRDASAMPSVWVGVLVGRLGRHGDTMVCGRSYVLPTGVGRYRSGSFAIPCDGLGTGRVAKGWDVSATPIIVRVQAIAWRC